MVFTGMLFVMVSIAAFRESVHKYLGKTIHPCPFMVGSGQENFQRSFQSSGDPDRAVQDDLGCIPLIHNPSFSNIMFPPSF